jgi:hypothetical protein
LIQVGLRTGDLQDQDMEQKNQNNF